MRRKVISMLLLSALLVVGTGAFVSCKDYDSDAIADVKGEVSDLNTLIKTQVETIYSTTDDLQSALDELSDLVGGQDVTDLADRVSDLENLTSDYTTVSSVAYDALAEAQAAADDAAEALERIAALEAALESMNSCTCEDVASVLEEILSEQYSGLLTLNEYADQLVEALESVSALSESLADYVTKDELATELEAINSTIESATSSLQDQIDAINTELAEVSATATTALVLAQQDSVRIDNIEAAVSTIGESISTIQSDIESLNSLTAQNTADITTLTESDSVNSENIAKLQEAVEEINEVVQAILDSAYATRTYVDSLYADAIEIAVSEAVSQAKEYVQEYVGDTLAYYMTSEEISETYATINTVETLQEALEAADAALQAQIDSLAEVTKALESEFELLNNKYASLITSINIDQISNPVFGSLNLPFGLKSTVLCTVWGTTTGNGTFPTLNEDDYVFPEEAEGWTILDGYEDYYNVINDMETGTITDGSAGTILLTINPGDVDADGIKVRLTSRSDDETPAAYGDYLTLEKSSESVTTRAVDASTNGAYEAVVTTSTDYDDLVASQLNVNESELYSAAKTVLNYLTSTLSTSSSSSGINVIDIAQTVYSNFTNAIPEYYALKCEWDDGEKERSIRSDYEIAAITMKPLSFATAKNGNGYSLPSLPTISELGLDFEITYDSINIDEISNVTLFSIGTDNVTENEDGSVTITIVSDLEVSADYTDGVVTLTQDADYIYMTFAEGSWEYVYDEDGNITGYAFIVNLDEINDIVSNLSSELYDMVGSMVESVEEQVQNMIDEINDSYLSTINNYLTRISNLLDTLETFINNPNKFLQPVLIYSNGDSYGRLSREKSVPSVFTVPDGSTSGSLTLYPTTFNAELLCPAYKKWVQVTKLSDEGSVSLNDGNGEVEGLLLDTKQTGIILTAEQGTDIEIVYSAIDYYGKVVARKYYVTIK